MILNYPLKVYSYYKYGFFKVILLTIRDLVFYPWGAMWYISALIIATCICYFFYKKNKLPQLCLIGLLLYLFALLCNNYYFVSNNSILRIIIDNYLKIAVSARNGIFEGILFVSTGMLISSKIDLINKINKNRLILFDIIFFILLIIEIIILYPYEYADDGSLFLNYIFLVPIIFCTLLKYQTSIDTIKVRNYSTGIYFSHRFIINILTLFSMIIKYSLSNTLIFALTILCVFIGLKLLYSLNNKYINMVIK